MNEKLKKKVTSALDKFAGNIEDARSVLRQQEKELKELQVEMEELAEEISDDAEATEQEKDEEEL